MALDTLSAEFAPLIKHLIARQYKMHIYLTSGLEWMKETSAATAFERSAILRFWQKTASGEIFIKEPLLRDVDPSFYVANVIGTEGSG